MEILLRGKNFSTIEIGKNKIKEFIKSSGVELFEYKGWETKELREKYGYKKVSEKAKDCFEAHNCDSLSFMFGGFGGGKGLPAVARGDEEATVTLDCFGKNQIATIPITNCYGIPDGDVIDIIV